MARVLDGHSAAATVLERVRAETEALRVATGVSPGLSVILVGEDPASLTYVSAKSRTAKACGFSSRQHSLPSDTTLEALLRLVDALNRDAEVHGILVQLPLPNGLPSAAVVQAILPEKDVDGLHVINAGKLATGDMSSGLVSCTPAGAMILLRSVEGPDLSGKRAIVLGRSNLFGKPMGQLLLNANATVTMAHSRTAGLPELCRQSEIVIAAVGRPEMVRASWIKPGATVIDVGINRVAAPERGLGKTRLVGDVAYDEVAQAAGAITPVPGGVGPMTIAMLMANTVTAACNASGRRPPAF